MTAKIVSQKVEIAITVDSRYEKTDVETKTKPFLLTKKAKLTKRKSAEIRRDFSEKKVTFFSVFISQSNKFRLQNNDEVYSSFD